MWLLSYNAVRYFLTLALLCKVSSVIAKDLQTVPYENTYECPNAIVHITGKRCMSEDTCPTVSFTQSEQAELATRIGKRFPIPPLTESFPKSKRILWDEGTVENPQPRIYSIEKVTCLQNKIGVLYGGGGNCSSGCENYVAYTISQEKGVVRAILSE